MNLLSWNIQTGRGTDGVCDLARIAASINHHQFPDGKGPDIICLQEVARGFPDVTGGTEVDQAAQLRNLFPGYHGAFRPAVDVAERGAGQMNRWQFGCMVLSRFPITQVFNHLLTQSGIVDKGMQRQALEVVVESPDGALRVVTTHLEYNSQDCRHKQAVQLRQLQEEVAAAPVQRADNPAKGTPYFVLERPADAVLCGDFNFLPDSPEYEAITASGPGDSGFIDAWRKLKPGTPHEGTCGWADPAQWPEGPHCRDFFFVSQGLAKQLTWIAVDTVVRASDHQPIMLALESKRVS